MDCGKYRDVPIAVGIVTAPLRRVNARGAAGFEPAAHLQDACAAGTRGSVCSVALAESASASLRTPRV